MRKAGVNCLTAIAPVVLPVLTGECGPHIRDPNDEPRLARQ